MIRTLLVLVALATAVTNTPALAQHVGQDQELRAPTVVVTGSRREQAETYVGQIAPGGGLAQLRGVPRWNTALCTSVIGPPAGQAQFIADRVSQRAIKAGLEAGAPGCDTNLLVIVTNDPGTLLPAIAEKHRDVFGFTGDANIDAGGSETSLASFMAVDRPVRWRQVIETVGENGMPLDGDARTDPLKYSQPPLANMPIVRADSTRLRSNVRRQLSRVVVVVDTRQTAGLSLGAVADYLAFVALADVSPDADLSGFPSILNLFNPDTDHPDALSDWDAAFLKGLYTARLNSASSTMQYREIAGRMVKE
ncbi:MAG: hypothetical protein FP825_00640 [Hyphomonas sp.]|uniref:hypothetical protein n=1 Tax=Hyphomonas sp. TaxID=87 RepID=UPI0017E9C11B|nr:hypothetical protein [Hyphomonas sp.]MBA3066974.1 hypothetical protein [Hyphomonas sp.]MBU4060522.1 hypothetical protein [Alphaproteobacteria bacterium]MBU4165790.1 hypothetical protein [Alphaproteobacteria bacterium]